MNPANKPEINHRDGVKLNNHVSNLEWVTNSENKQSALKSGLRPSGSDHPQAKLTADQVVYVRNNPDGLTVTQLAEMFDTKVAVISKVQLGDCYKNNGGIIREKIWCRISDDVREQIRADYQNGVRGCGYRALAKKYGVDPTTIKKIVNEK